MERESFIFYGSFYEAIRRLPKDEQTDAYTMIMEYALHGRETDDDTLACAFFKLIKPQIDANNRRFENGKKGSEYGRLGGRPRKEKTAKKPQNAETKTPTKPQTGENENPKETPRKPLRGKNENPKQTPNVNVNVNENVNEYDCLSVSHIGETDGLTDDERAIEFYGESVVREAREKKLPIFAAFYLDCARGRMQEAGMNLCEYPASRYLEILEGVGRLATVKIGGATLPSEAVMREIVSLSADPTTLDTALARTTGDGEHEIKNKKGYAISTLYNFAKGY